MTRYTIILLLLAGCAAPMPPIPREQPALASPKALALAMPKAMLAVPQSLSISEQLPIPPQIRFILQWPQSATNWADTDISVTYNANDGQRFVRTIVTQNEIEIQDTQDLAGQWSMVTRNWFTNAIGQAWKIRAQTQ